MESPVEKSTLSQPYRRHRPTQVLLQIPQTPHTPDGVKKNFLWYVGSSIETTFTAPTSGLSALKTLPSLLQDIVHLKLFLWVCETSEVASKIQVATGHCVQLHDLDSLE